MGNNVSSKSSVYSTLIDDIIAKKSEVVIAAINRGVDIDIQGPKGTTPLILASIHGMDDVIMALLKRGVNINAEDYEGNTALIHACRAKNEATALLLIENHADVLSPRGMGRTPLMAAASEGRMDVVQEILKNPGATKDYINLKDEKVETALQIAIRKRESNPTNIGMFKRYNDIIAGIEGKLSQLGGRRKRTRRQRKHSRKQKHRK
jgi:ankyrin repeat protein